MPAQAWVTLIVGTAATVVVMLAVHQRTRAINSARQWKRINWCLERTASDNQNEVALGWLLYGVVAKTKFVTGTERDALQVMAVHAARRDPADVEGRRRVAAAAAGAAIALAEYDNKPVPQWLRDAAAGRKVTPPDD